MTQETIDLGLRIIFLLIWVLIIGGIGFILYKLNKAESQKAVDEIKLREGEIEKKVDSTDINELIDLNNKERHKSDS